MYELYEEAIAFIKKVKHFGESELGIDFRGSFERVSENCAHAYWLTATYPYALKKSLTRVTFSMSESEILQIADWYEKSCFVSYIFRGEAHSGSQCPILPSLLNASRGRQANVVLHEGLHSLLRGAPFRRNRDLDESSASLICYYGALSFAEFECDEVLRQEILFALDWWLRYCNFINGAIGELSAIYRTYSAADLPEVYTRTLARTIEEGITSGVLSEREKLRNTINAAYFLHQQPYTTFYPLILKAHQILGADVKKTLKFLLSMPAKRKDALAALQAVVGHP